MAQSDWKTFKATGETEAKLQAALDFLVHTVAGLCGDESEGRIGSFVHPGLSRSDRPWLILVGHGGVMCEHATETARKVPAKFKEAYDIIDLPEEDNDAE